MHFRLNEQCSDTVIRGAFKEDSWGAVAFLHNSLLVHQNVANVQ
uniref:Uncharacterized protein n=1 Tax=Anguilla anguilla TaxID=7936 RepID=A0A0E9SB62_ANGAN